MHGLDRYLATTDTETLVRDYAFYAPGSFESVEILRVIETRAAVSWSIEILANPERWSEIEGLHFLVTDDTPTVA